VPQRWEFAMSAGQQARARPGTPPPKHRQGRRACRRAQAGRHPRQASGAPRRVPGRSRAELTGRTAAYMEENVRCSSPHESYRQTRCCCWLGTDEPCPTGVAAAVAVVGGGGAGRVGGIRLNGTDMDSSAPSASVMQRSATACSSDRPAAGVPAPRPNSNCWRWR